MPLATTEGALVRSYERGMVALTRAGGVTTRVYVDENRVSPVFLFDSVARRISFVVTLPKKFETIRAEAESTTRHGKLLRVECHAIGREVIVNFCYFTGDAQGMNMIVKATEHACQMDHGTSADAVRYYVFSGIELREARQRLTLAGGKGKKVTAGALLPARYRASPTCTPHLSA